MYEQILNRLELFLERDGYRGWDPYDGLNSSFLKALTFNSKFLRIATIQAMKRSPINFRPLLAVQKTKNPKALGLLANAYLLRYKNGHKEQYLIKAQEILDWLIANSSAGYSGYCWGYSFDWQSSVFYLPKGVPTIVNTSIIANAFLDAYEITRDKNYLDVARSCCDFILKDLNRTALAQGKEHRAQGIGHGAEAKGHCENQSNQSSKSCVEITKLQNYAITMDVPFCFSYSPLDTQCVHNANLFAAGLLARVHHFTGEENLRIPAESSLAFSLSEQNSDGSWYYGHAKEELYVDNFHTGFLLVSLKNILSHIEPQEASVFKRMLLKGYDYYKRTFFGADGMPHYRTDSIYPVDLHCSAQGIITFLEFADYDREAVGIARDIAGWALTNMWNDTDGCFYFQKTKILTNRVSYFRWPNVWMYYALAKLALYGLQT